MKLRDIYGNFIAHWISDGQLVKRENISAVGIKAGYGRITTNKYIRKMFIVTSFPNHYDINLAEAIRAFSFRDFPSVKVFVTEHNTMKRVPIETDNFKRLRERAADKAMTYKQIMNSFSNEEQEVGKTVRMNSRKYVFTNRRRQQLENEYQSYRYVTNHQSNGGFFNRTVYTIEVLCPNDRVMKAYKTFITNFLRGQGIGFKEIKQESSTFLENYGVASFPKDSSSVRSMLLSDENLADNSIYRVKGLVGGSGIYLGVDVNTNLPLLVNFFESSAAQVSLIYGRTGSGKTYCAFNIAHSLMNEGVHCSAIDIKGNEWTKLKPYCNLLEISMGNVDSRFVNTMRLDDLNANDDNCQYYFNMAVSGTVQLLSLMVNLLPNEGNPMDLNNLLEQAVLKVYSDYGVKMDKPETFKNTETIKIQDVLPKLVALQTSTTFEGTDKARLVKMVVDRCSIFLGVEGRNAAAFANEITIADIINHDMVVYAFDKNDSTLDLLDTLRVFMVQYLDTKKQSIRKSLGLHTAAFYEELQRSDRVGDLLGYIKHSVTGSRSNNVLLFLLINNLADLDHGALESVKSSVTTKIIGKSNDNDVERLVNDYNCRHIKDDILRLREDGYQHCFVIDFDTGKTIDTTIFKTILPPDIMESFRTKDLKED